MKHVDTIIIGQGIAGTALAWELMWSGQSVLIVDREEVVTSSKIAAGLITPITGKRLVPNWKYEEFWEPARAFYRRVESAVGRTVCDELSMLRLFQSETERELFQSKKDIYSSTVSEIDCDGLNGFNAPLGAFEMENAGRLRVSEYLEASQEYFHSNNQYVAVNLDVANDIKVDDSRVDIPRLNVTASHIAFCQGHIAPQNPWFASVPYNPAKGEILTLKIPGLCEDHIVHCGVWLVPLGDDLFRCGSTYEWEQIDYEPTGAGRDDIVKRLQRFVNLPIEVVEHQAAVRPVLMDSKPRIGPHPEFSRLLFFNGLGSKGSLQGPLLAKHLSQHITHQTTIPPEFALQAVWTTS